MTIARARCRGVKTVGRGSADVARTTGLTPDPSSQGRSGRAPGQRGLDPSDLPLRRLKGENELQSPALVTSYHGQRSLMGVGYSLDDRQANSRTFDAAPIATPEPFLQPIEMSIGYGITIVLNDELRPLAYPYNYRRANPRMSGSVVHQVLERQRYRFAVPGHFYHIA